MTDKPISISRYIKLCTKNALERETILHWLECVTAEGPSGVIATVQTVDDKGRPRAVRVVHRETDGKHCYLVPLTRDLNTKEVEEITHAFALEEPDLDFDIETSETRIDPSERKSISVDHADHLALCMALAKQKHEDWMRERTDAGWRYGPKFSTTNKTHPLLRPWDQLPDRYREPDLTWPQKLIDLLNSQGYVVMAKDDLERLMASIRGGV